MVEKFIEEYARLIVSHPENIDSKVDETYEMYEITLFAHSDDLGKLIGKEGKMIGAIKNIVSGCKAKNGKNYKINVRVK